MVTLKQAKVLSNSDWLVRKDGSRWRVTSVKTWKRKPSEVSVGLKHGLYTYDKIGRSDLDKFKIEGSTKSVNARAKKGITVGSPIKLSKEFGLGEVKVGTKGVISGKWGSDFKVKFPKGSRDVEYVVPIEKLRKLPTRR